MYMLSLPLLTLVSDGELMTQAEKFPDPFCSRAMLICSIIWLEKADGVAGCCSAGSVLR